MHCRRNRLDPQHAGKKKSQNLVNVLLFDQKKKKLSRKNLKISKPSTVVRKICMPQKEAGSMVYNSYLT